MSCLNCILHLDGVDAVVLRFLFLQFSCHGDNL